MCHSKGILGMHHFRSSPCLSASIAIQKSQQKIFMPQAKANAKSALSQTFGFTVSKTLTAFKNTTGNAAACHIEFKRKRNTSKPMLASKQKRKRLACTEKNTQWCTHLMSSPTTQFVTANFCQPAYVQFAIQPAKLKNTMMTTQNRLKFAGCVSNATNNGIGTTSQFMNNLF